MGIESYRDLDAWQIGVSIAVETYRLTKPFPREEMFGLTSQMRRAAVSIAANIAEGFGRETTQEYIRGLRVAQGSLKELETHLEIALRVEMTNVDNARTLVELCDRGGRIIRALIRALEGRQ